MELVWFQAANEPQLGPVQELHGLLTAEPLLQACLPDFTIAVNFDFFCIHLATTLEYEDDLLLYFLIYYFILCDECFTCTYVCILYACLLLGEVRRGCPLVLEL